MTLKDTLQMEDYEEEGYVAMAAIKEAFQTLDIEIEEELLDYIFYTLYQKTQSVDQMSYNILIDMIEGNFTDPILSHAPGSTDGAPSRKRPESSSPEKLKARNKDKFQQAAS